MAGTLVEPTKGKITVLSIAGQKAVKRFNTGRIPATAVEIASGDDKDLDITGFVNKARLLELAVFAEGLDASDFDIELFSVATSDGSPASDRYRVYQWQNIDTQEVDGLDVECIIEDQDKSETLHVRITNNTATTMHVSDIELQVEELLV